MITARMAAALRAGTPLALLAAIDHPDGMVRVWSRSGTLTYAGHEWIGLGVLGRVTPISSSLELAIQAVAFELRGVPETATEFLNSNVRGRIANLWLACVDKGRRIVADPIDLGDSELDYQTLEAADDLGATIRLVGNRGFYTLERAQRLAWSGEEQHRRFPDDPDSGFDLMTQSAVKEIKWDIS